MGATKRNNRFWGPLLEGTTLAFGLEVKTGPNIVVRQYLYLQVYHLSCLLYKNFQTGSSLLNRVV